MSPPGSIATNENKGAVFVVVVVATRRTQRRRRATRRVLRVRHRDRSRSRLSCSLLLLAKPTKAKVPSLTFLVAIENPSEKNLKKKMMRMYRQESPIRGLREETR